MIITIKQAKVTALLQFENYTVMRSTAETRLVLRMVWRELKHALPTASAYATYNAMMKK